MALSSDSSSDSEREPIRLNDEEGDIMSLFASDSDEGSFSGFSNIHVQIL